jgi:hypothetical protein
MGTYLDPKLATSLVRKCLHPLDVDASLEDHNKLLLLCIQGITVTPIHRKYWSTHEDLENLCFTLRGAIH